MRQANCSFCQTLYSPDSPALVTEGGAAICSRCAESALAILRARLGAESQPRREPATGMPDLSDLRKHLLGAHRLNWYFRGAYVRDQKTRQYLVSFIKVVDNAVAEYESARTLLEDHASELSFSRNVNAVSHLETCANRAKRALNILEKMNSYRHAPSPDRTIMRSLVRTGQSIGNVRHAIEHMDERIMRGESRQGEAFVLVVSDDGDAVEIGDLRVSFLDLAAALRKLHGIADDLTNYRNPDAAPMSVTKS